MHAVTELQASEDLYMPVLAIVCLSKCDRAEEAKCMLFQQAVLIPAGDQKQAAC